MKFVDIAKEFADLNIFNTYTRSRILGIADIFSIRSGTKIAGEITLQSLSDFKFKTLQLAKPVTYNGYLKYLRIIGDYAVSQHLLEKNIFRQVKLAALGEPPKKTLEYDEISKAHQYILANKEAHNPYWFWITVIYCLFYTGMRRRQLVNLKRSDIDFDKRTILLSYEGSKTRREWTIPIHDELLPMLKLLIIDSEKTLGRQLGKNELVFDVTLFNDRYVPSEKGGMKPEAITGFFKRLTRKANVRIGAQRFRHTLATTLCNPEDDSSPDIFATQAILGHTNLQTTRGYVKTSVRRMNKTLQKIGVPFNSGRETHLTSVCEMHDPTQDSQSSAI